jgi:WXG100 family type VII secretion target
MPNVNVTYEEMQSAAAQLKNGQSTLEQELNRLKQLIDNLVASGFTTDTASGAFQSTYEKFTQGSIQTISGLEGMSEFLTRAADTMQQTDASLARAISG